MSANSESNSVNQETNPQDNATKGKSIKKSAYELWIGLKTIFQQEYVRAHNSNQMAKFWRKAAKETSYKDGNGLRNRANETVFKWVKAKLDAQGINNTGGSQICYLDVVKAKRGEITELQAKEIVCFYTDIIGTGKKFTSVTNQEPGKLVNYTPSKPTVPMILKDISDCKKRTLEMMEDAQVMEYKKQKYKTDIYLSNVKQLQVMLDYKKIAIQDNDLEMMDFWNDQIIGTKAKLIN